MGLVQKPEENKNKQLTKNDLQFILQKLENAEYKGKEFEQYFFVVKKITEHLKQFNQQQ